ncbi:MAG: tetratricopeptide repeat protein [Candidatus Sumerlaeaceae bacterium]
MVSWVLGRKVVTGILLMLTYALGAADTTEPATLGTTATLRAKPDFFPVVFEDRKTTLPTTSLIAGDSSATLGTVTVDLSSTDTLSLGRGAVAVTTSPQVLASVELSPSLPIEVDRSTTAAMVRQLHELEKRNLYAEAFLLACQLVRENPDAEFAYDAAIRTGIVLSHANPDQMEQELEFFFHEAKRTATLPGRYVLQQAHYYERMGKLEKFRKLVSEYEKHNTKDPDYWVTLARLYAMSGETARSREFLERALREVQDVFPLVLLAARLYREFGSFDKARQTLIAAVDQNYGPWQMRSLLLEFLKLPTFDPPDVAQMVRGALANEVRYSVARGLADAIVERAIERRVFFRFQRFLDERIAAKKASDVEMWLAALLAQRAGDDKRSFEILMLDPAKTTPVISYERALALAREGRHKEAHDILAILVAEQPLEIPFRLAMAREELATSRPLDVLETLSRLRLEELTGSDRDDFIDTAMKAAVMTGNPQRIIDLWLDLVGAATFAEIQTMGDIVVRALENDPQAQHIEDAIADAVRQPERWPLLALHARLYGRHGNHRAEIESYAAYLEHAADDTQMLRFAAQLALQYATRPLHMEASAERQSTATVRLLDNTLVEHAASFYRRLIALQPMVGDNYSALMRVYQARGEIEAAKKVAAELAEKNTSSPELLATAATILEENGFLNEALHYYERALQADPSDYGVWLKYADALLAAGSHKQAELICKKMLEEGYSGKPYNQPTLLAYLLKLATLTRETSGLVEYLSSLREKNIPGKPEFLLSSAKLLLQIGAPDQAVASVAKFQKDFPGHTLLQESYLLAGQIWYSRGDIEKAIATFRLVEEKFPQSQAAITAAFNIAVAQASAGRIDEALETYRRIAKQYSNDDHALGALFEAAVLASRAHKDPVLIKTLLEQFLATDCQDFSLRRNARKALDALEAGKQPFATTQAVPPKSSRI